MKRQRTAACLDTTEISEPICVLESDFGFKINCAFKKSGLFRVRNLGGLKAHASIGFSLGDELGFEQSLTNLDPSRRRSVNVKNGAPPNLVDPTRSPKQEKRGKQNRIMMRPVAPPNTRPNQAAMDKLTSLHRRVSSTMQPIVVSGSTVEGPTIIPRAATVTMAKPLPMGIPAFRPLPPKEETLKVLPITTKFTPLQIPESKGPGLAYQSEITPQYPSHNQISKMVSQMTAVQYGQYGHPIRITPAPIIVEPLYSLPTTVNPFVPLPVQAPPYQTGLTIIPAPAFKHINPQVPQYNPNPNPSFVDFVPHKVHDIANNYAYNTKKVDDYNSITGYSDDTVLKFNKEDINSKIAEIAKAGNISMEAVEAAIALRQQQLLNKYASLPVPSTTSSTTTSEKPVVFREPEPEVVAPQKPKRAPTTGKVMNAPREYYPVGYEKNFDDHFQSKVDLPDTNFHCGDQKYFPGLYGDETLGCMVFHVCALTDDGLVMKSFLCPESTLFDQTILKCNWWFYVDCKNTRKLYDTNIPVSKSYQLMKALTFFSSYKKEVADGRPTNPEDVEGIKEAISILQNQDTKDTVKSNSDNIQIITPQPLLIDERNNHKIEISTEPSPVYNRGNRNLNVTNINEAQRININLAKINQAQAIINSQDSTNNNQEVKLITVKAGFNFKQNESNSSSETDKKHRRRMTLRFSNSTTTSKTTTSRPPTTTRFVTTSTTAPSTTNKFEYTTPSIEIIRQEIQPIENFQIKQETLTDQIDFNTNHRDSIVPVKRYHRSSAEIKERQEILDKSSAEKLDKEIALLNNEKVQIIRPTPMAKLVGQFATPLATIAKLDEAVLGNTRTKKEISIVTPQRYLDPTEKT